MVPREKKNNFKINKHAKGACGRGVAQNTEIVPSNQHWPCGESVINQTPDLLDKRELNPLKRIELTLNVD